MTSKPPSCHSNSPEHAIHLLRGVHPLILMLIALFLSSYNSPSLLQSRLIMSILRPLQQYPLAHKITRPNTIQTYDWHALIAWSRHALLGCSWGVLAVLVFVVARQLVGRIWVREYPATELVRFHFSFQLGSSDVQTCFIFQCFPKQFTVVLGFVDIVFCRGNRFGLVKKVVCFP